MINKISFGSKINFVPCYKFLSDHEKGKYIDFKEHFINVEEAPEFYTMSIADCNAGGIISPHKKSMGFHINGLYYLKDGPFDICGTPERALLIGSKRNIFSPNSITNFNVLQKYLQNKVKHLTYFQEHKPLFSASDIHYSLDNDTWTISTQYGVLSEVKSIKDLFRVFRKIKIANGDSLFIDEKEILPKDFPDIFE